MHATGFETKKLGVRTRLDVYTKLTSCTKGNVIWCRQDDVCGMSENEHVINGKTIAKQHEGIKRPLFLGRVVRKLVNANPRLKVNRSIFFFFCINMFFTAYFCVL